MWEGVNYPQTALHAVSNGFTHGSLALARRLLARKPAGCDLDVGRGAGGSPLDLAVHSGLSEIALLLIRHGADVNARDGGGGTPLMRAAAIETAIGGSDLIKLLVANGARLDAADSRGRTAAHWAGAWFYHNPAAAPHFWSSHPAISLAAEYGQVDALRVLRQLDEAAGEKHAASEEGAAGGRTPHLAARIPLLRQVDKNGRTPLALAREQHGSDYALLAALRDVAEAIPLPRSLLADASFSLEELPISVDVNVDLPKDFIFIAECVPLVGRPGAADEASPAEACGCVICIPGACPSLKVSVGSRAPSAACLHNVAAELDWSERTAHAGLLRKCMDSPPHRAFALLISTKHPVLICFATARALIKLLSSDHPRAAAAAGAALYLLPSLPDLVPSGTSRGVSESWRRRVRLAAETPAGDLDSLGALLLEAEEALLVSLRTAAAAGGVWQIRQTRVYETDFRPSWRAGVRFRRFGKPATAHDLVASMCELVAAVRSTHTVLRIAEPVPDNISRDLTLHVCSPHCVCAAGGCRGLGMQYPLRLKNTNGRCVCPHMWLMSDH